MEIRTMTINDYEAVYALWMSCTGMGLNNLDDSEEGIDRFLQRNPETCFVAVNADKIVGVIIAAMMDEEVTFIILRLILHTENRE